MFTVTYGDVVAEDKIKLSNCFVSLLENERVRKYLTSLIRTAEQVTLGMNGLLLIVL